MEETILKKEFKQSDVERVRNIVRKDYGASTKNQVGYSKKRIKYKEGEVFEEYERQWVIKDGIKQSVTKLDAVKAEVRVPFSCPQCSKPMHHHLDKKMYKIHGFCFDCTLNYEADLKKAGLYSEYEKSMITGNMNSFVGNMTDWLQDQLKIKNNYVTEAGDLEEWENNNSHKEKLISNINKFKQAVEKHNT